MDALAALLDGPRAHGAFVLRTVLASPWSIRCEDRSPLTVCAVVRGHAWVVSDDGREVLLHPGDVAVARGVESYTIADDPSRKPDVVILPGQRCTTPAGVELHDVMSIGVRTWGNDQDGETMLLIGSYQIEGEVSARLLNALPVRCRVDADRSERRLIELLADEAAKDQQGQQAVLDRLLDLLLISTLRAWFDGEKGNAPAWYRAHADSIVGAALRLIHDNPAHSWTIASLARKIGVARPTLARRFSELMGEPPISYLTSWRIAVAADLLAEPGATVSSVAPKVGYGTPYAFSIAFKRELGVSPSEYAAKVRRGAA